MTWREKTVVITGGATDLGRAIAGSFADAGAVVVLADRSREGLQAAKAAIGGQTYPALADVGDETHLAQLFAPLERVDVLVCCASGAGAPAPIEDTTAETLAAALEVGVYGSYWAAKHALPKMGAGGCIVFVSSAPAPYASAQSLVGGAVEALTRALAAELDARGVRVNCVALGSDDLAALKDDAAGVVRLLAGATHITGAVIAVDGSAARR